MVGPGGFAGSPCPVCQVTLVMPETPPEAVPATEMVEVFTLVTTEAGTVIEIDIGLAGEAGTPDGAYGTTIVCEAAARAES